MYVRMYIFGMYIHFVKMQLLASTVAPLARSQFVCSAVPCHFVSSISPNQRDIFAGPVTTFSFS